MCSLSPSSTLPLAWAVDGRKSGEDMRRMSPLSPSSPLPLAWAVDGRCTTRAGGAALKSGDGGAIRGLGERKFCWFWRDGKVPRGRRRAELSSGRSAVKSNVCTILLGACTCRFLSAIRWRSCRPCKGLGLVLSSRLAPRGGRHRNCSPICVYAPRLQDS